MNDYILSCCSTADLSAEHLKARNIPFLSYPYTFNGERRLDDMGQSMPMEDFYKALADGAEVTSSQINIDEYMSFFRSFFEQGKDVLHIAFSTGLTQSSRNAIIAGQILAEDFPERRLCVVDSLAASSGYGLLVDTLADLRDGGMGFDELRDWAEENKCRVQHWFLSGDLSFYIKGGRISKAAGTVATMLGICPLMNVDAEGRLAVVEKVRSKRRVIEAIVGKMEQLAEGGTDYSGKCFISHSGCEADALAVMNLICERFPKLAARPSLFSIGTVIGCHTGPGTVALFFWGNDRRGE